VEVAVEAAVEVQAEDSGVFFPNLRLQKYLIFISVLLVNLSISKFIFPLQLITTDYWLKIDAHHSDSHLSIKSLLFGVSKFGIS